MPIKVKYQAPLVVKNGAFVRGKNGLYARKAGRPSANKPATHALTEKQQIANRLLGEVHRHILLKGGSRSGKTYLLVRAIVIRASKYPGSRHAIFRLRFNAVKESIWLDTLPKVLRECFPDLKAHWNNGDHYLTLANKSEIWIGGLDDQERVEKILGKEYATLFFNECSQIPYSSVAIALTRLTQKIDGCVNRAYYDLNPTTTGHWTNRLFIQKRRADSQERVPDPENYVFYTINPEDNAKNIDSEALKELRNMPERLKRRFYQGEYASEIPGQLWTLDTIEKCRITKEDLPPMKRIVIAIDPSGARGANDTKADEIGLVATGMGDDDRGYLLEDCTGLHSPEQWGRIAGDMFERWGADRILGERNYGGDMVRAVIHGHKRTLPFREVVASRGKTVRAEPVSALYERDMIRHVGHFPVLEEQLTNFLTAGYVGEGSPNNADAMIWGMTDLFNLKMSLAGFYPMISVTKSGEGGGDGLERSSGWRMGTSVGSRWGQG